MSKVLILGNSNHINKIDFDRLNDDVITLGVNRIWYKFIPDYFTFSDSIIYNELMEKKMFSKLNNSKIILNDWMIRQRNKHERYMYKKIKAHDNVLSYKTLTHIPFPDSVCSGLFAYHKFINKNSDVTYYIAGVDLKYDENKNHFWTGEYTNKNKLTKEWYEPRFKRMWQNWLILKDHKLKIISVNPKSELNKLFPYKNINILYK